VGISRAFLDPLASYLAMAKGMSPMAVIGDQAVRCSQVDVRVSLEPRSRIARWIMSRATNEHQPLDLKNLLHMFGIERAVTVDLFGDPDVTLDLAAPLPVQHRGAYRSVLEIGTIEHVIDPLRALRNVDEMLQSGGVVIHLCPVKERQNHGYYTISPQLLHDFYLVDGSYDLVRCDLLSFFAGYDSLASPFWASPYVLGQDLAHHRSLGLGRAFVRKLRRIAVRLSAGTYIGFVARKNRNVPEATRVQKHWAGDAS
jgi:hypothetical protein